MILSFVGERCEKGWHYYGGSCYFGENRIKHASWADAQSVCRSKQANLVTVNDEDEMNFLSDILGTRGSWCGLNNQANATTFEWVSGEQSDYTYWALKEPLKSTKKRCVHILTETLGNKWEMSNCDRKYRYTCEKGRSRSILDPGPLNSKQPADFRHVDQSCNH